MSATFHIHQVGDVTIVDVGGRVTIGEGSSNLRDVVVGLITQGKNKIVLNLQDTMYFDSSGVGELVSGFSKVANSGGSLKLLSLTKRIQDMLQITKLHTIFEVFDDQNEAVGSFNTLPPKREIW